MRFFPWLALSVLGAAGLLPRAAAEEPPAQAVATAALRQVFRVDARLYSGAGPEDEAAFRELAALGVKTLISVDGAAPRVALARQFGLRYVHLPLGYDGVPQARANELTKAVQTAVADGPVYLHCHHGRHRGPAAVAVVCRALEGWSGEKAVAFLRQAGTASEYAGLFRDVRAFRPPDAAVLARLPAAFPESVKTPPLVEAMVALDEHFDALKAAQKAAWRALPSGPPAQAAVLLHEQFRELARDPETPRRGTDYTKLLTAAEQAAAELRELLHDPTAPAAARDAAFSRAGKSCATCHQAHRN